MATPGALNAFAATGENPINYIIRHMNLDPGSLGAEDQLQNATSFKFTAKTPPFGFPTSLCTPSLNACSPRDPKT